MANKVFKFDENDIDYLNSTILSSSQLSSQINSLEVYRDISMNATKSGIDDDGKIIYKIGKNVNAKAVSDSLHNIFTWLKGERILLPEFGSDLRKLLYEGITPITEERIVAEIRSCVSEWEPRAQIGNIVNVSTVDDTEDNTIHLEIMYTIPGLSEEQYKYSFYFNSAE